MRNNTALWLITGLVVYSLTAWFSEGYHHPDEHFQILEFAYAKLSPTPLPYSLAWEYEAQIRPGLQPFLAWCLMKVSSSTGISNPFVQSFLMRWIIGVCAFFIYWKYINYLFDNQRIVALFSVVFLWFMPYLSVRFSSEQCAGLSFLIACYAIMRKTDWKYWVFAGLFFSLSFHLRYQMGFAILGIGVWLIWQHRVYKLPKVLLGLLVGALCGFILGSLADYWLYQEWAFPYINYFRVNILEHKAAQWGSSPFWFYPFEFILSAIPPISVFILFFAVWGGWRHRHHLLIWGVVPFIIGHSLVGHKELRFMFPMVFPILIFALWGFEEASNLKKHRMFRLLGLAAIAINMFFWVGRSVTAAQEAIPNLHFLYHYAEKEAFTLYVLDKSPYDLVGPEANYLKHPKINLLVIKDISEIRVEGNTLFLSKTLVVPTETEALPKQRIYTYLPEWILGYNINNWQDRSRIWSIWKLD